MSGLINVYYQGKTVFICIGVVGVTLNILFEMQIVFIIILFYIT